VDAERRKRIEALFDAALDLSADGRDAWVAAAADGDAELEAEVRALLAAHERVDGLLERDARATARALAEDEPRNRRIGPYRILRELGRGGMGVVYLAERDDGQFRRRVAIKLLRRGGDAEELHRRFLAERQILASLDHPNIAQLLDGGVTDGLLPFLVMEYVEGMPITEYCDRNGLQIAERLRLFQDVCAAVDHAHQNLIIHRDLKPSNVMVTTAGQVKLLDFGIAKLLNPVLGAVSAPITRTQFRVMTPEYASPEQMRGEPLTTTTDVYSLGVLLYELLAGHSPYRTTQGAAHEVVGAVMTDEPERPSTKVLSPRFVVSVAGGTREIAAETIASVRATTPDRLRRQLRGDLDAIVLMALRKEPQRRYASAALLSQDVGRHLAREPVFAHRGSRAYRAGKLLQRHAAESIAAAAVVLALLGGAGFAFWQAGVADRERARAELALVQAEEALEQSREVTAFLMGLFEANDPATVRGDQITARELLERGIARSDQLAGRPMLQAQLLDVIGRVFTSLGQYDRAHPLLERALATRREELGPRHPEVASALSALGTVLRSEGRYIEAEPLYRAALDIRREAFGGDHTSVGVSLRDVGLILHLRGDFDEAETMYRQALDVQRALGEEDPEVIRLGYLIGVVLRDKGEVEEAERALLRTVDLRRKVHGDVHLEVANDLIQIGSIRLLRNDPAGAESPQREALAIRRQVFGDEHPSVAQAIVGLAMVLADLGEGEEAETLYLEGIEMQRRLLGPDHPLLSNSLNSLGLLLLNRGDLTAAERAFREAIDINERAFGREHSNVAVAMENLARVLARSGRPAEAEMIFRETLDLRRRLLGDNHHYVGESLRRLAALLSQEGRHAEAEPLFLEALAIYEGSGVGETAEAVRTDLVSLYLSLDRPADAERYRAGVPPSSIPMRP
jgi:eukaryotic-like serine/threonine-protein kinase